MTVMARARVCAPVSAPCKKPVLSTDADGAHRSLGGVVVDGNASIFKEQAKRRPTAQAIAEGFSQITFARDARQLLFSPVFERRYLWFAQRLTCGKACVSGLAYDLALNVIEFSDMVEGLTCDL